TERPGAITRPYGTPALRQAQDLVAGWMAAAGLTTRRDAIGNLIGRYEGATDDALLLLLGSHLDSVVDAGRYDGPLGVLIALAAVERLHASNRRLPGAIDLLAFADEEGLRFHTAYLGSRAWAGAFDADLLARADADGVTLAEAARQFGGDPDSLLRAEGPGRPTLLGYVEAHIEQGPALEALGLPLGVVSAIAGQSRVAVAFSGMAGHAGTVAMPLRRDALPAAAAFVLAVEALAGATDGLVATVGQIAAEPGASNVIPGRVNLSLDVRHPDDAVRADARDRLHAEAKAIAARRGLDLAWDVLQENPAVACDPALSARLADAVAAGGWPVHRLASGAGHDGVIVSRLAPVAMLFVRCAGGVSHNPAEAVTVEDVAAAIAVFDRLLDGIDRDFAAGAFAP
ncbi:MAG TPA: allantoate amidohydrolase, partial [Thermomicrobiales bacterium]|nr:allantoate amidohydrolase [Thermomicrobiales bacterium]